MRCHFLRHIVMASLGCLFLLLAVSTPSHAQEGPTPQVQGDIFPSASMNERVLDIPGNPASPAILKVTILSPDGPGPFPLVVMNHGTANTARTDLEPRYRYSFSSYYFLSRGYAVALPMMRGFAGSQGHQYYGGCNQEEVGIENAKDILAVIDFMSAQSYIDPDHIVVAGQSFGGWNTLALGTLNPPRVRGLIDFNGGIIISNCDRTQSTLASAAAHYGARSRIPSLWFYGDNDSKFAPSVWRAMYESYTAAGGKADLVAFGPFMIDSHNLLGYPEGLAIWAPKVDAFLHRLEMPHTITHPEYLPMDFPPPSNFAAIGDVDAVPYLNDNLLKMYRIFLSQEMPRVFAISASGTQFITVHGGFDPIGRLLKECEKQAHKCKLYAVDDYVVWTRPTPAPPPTHFAPLADASVVPYIGEGGRKGYQSYLKMPKPKAFVIAPNGGWAAGSLGMDPLAAAMESCGKANQGCRFYAVDDNVVWPE